MAAAQTAQARKTHRLLLLLHPQAAEVLPLRQKDLPPAAGEPCADTRATPPSTGPCPTPTTSPSGWTPAGSSSTATTYICDACGAAFSLEELAG